MSDITRKGLDKVKQWKRANENLAYCQSQLDKAECVATTATMELGKFLLPHDAKEGEVYCVWFGDSLVSGQKEGDDVIVKLRTKGKSWEDMNR